MRSTNFLVFIISFLGYSVHGFVPCRIHKKVQAPISTFSPRAYGEPKRNIRPVVVRRECPSKLQAVPSIAALHSNSNYILSMILWLSTFGISLERRTVIGKALSAPLATMALALTTANIGLLPFHSPVYAMVNQYLVPLAVPLLLFDSDLKRVIKDTGTLLLAFGVGAVATIVGTIVAFPLIPLHSLGPDVGWRVACALAARHIGGASKYFVTWILVSCLYCCICAIDALRCFHL